MRHLFVFLLIPFLLWGCRQNRGREPEKPVILVSILPQKTFVEKIGGDDFRVEVLIPHGANPSTYSLLPAQMETISGASAWFRMGYIGFELAWAARIEETRPAMKIINLSEGLDLITAGSAGNEQFQSGTDPHTWLSPGNVGKMAARILRELTLIHPGKSAMYQERYQAFSEEISQTDSELREILRNCQGKKFITYHPSLTYLARDYGLVQLSIEQGGKEPTPSRMAELVLTAEKEGIRVVYIQSEFDLEIAKVLSEETGGRVIQVWPLNPDWSTNLKQMAQLLSEN